MSVGARSICATAEMRRLEQAAGRAGLTEAELMEAAGAAMFDALRAAVGGVAGKRALVLVGPGNNGGDGLVVARYLCRAGAQVQVLLSRERPGDANLRLAAEAGATVQLYKEGGVREAAAAADLIFDALLGMGSSPPVRESIGRILAEAGAVSGPYRVACDIPSGVDADTGQADAAAFRADLTVAAGPVKAGLLLFPAHRFAGRILETDIGLPRAELAALPGRAVVAEAVAKFLPPRPPESHKGTFGKALVIAGSRSYRGAAALACMGALRAGAGLVTLAAIEPVVAAAAARFSSATFEVLDEAAGGIAAAAAERVAKLLGEADGAVLGPGLGRRKETDAFVRAVLASAPAGAKLVLDADGLNAVAPADAVLKQCKAGLLLTPHPGEMARLLGNSPAEVQADRLSAARRAADLTGQVVMLKGAGTVIAEPGGAYAIAPFAVPALATAGSGDVLAGILTALLAQRLALGEAARLGFVILALAGQEMGRKLGPAGATADDLPLEIPGILERLRAMGGTG